MKHVIPKNVRPGNCPSWKFPFGELSVWGTVRCRNVLSGNCPFGKLFSGELPVRELSVGKCLWGTVRRGKVRIPVLDHHHLIFSIMKTTFASEEPKNFVYRKYKTFSHENFKNKLMSKTVEENC